MKEKDETVERGGKTYTHKHTHTHTQASAGGKGKERGRRWRRVIKDPRKDAKSVMRK